MRWPTNKEQHAYMKLRQKEQLLKARWNPAEVWMYKKLLSTGLSWRRQAQWGYRLFDFWCAKLKIAIEVDGTSHNADYDAFRDSYNLKRSKILVLRVRNYNEEDAEKALKIIHLFK